VNVAASDAIVFLVSGGTRTGSSECCATDNHFRVDNMFWIVRTVYVLALVVLTLIHVVDGPVGMLCEL
jgi:hypothetical protein